MASCLCRCSCCCSESIFVAIGTSLVSVIATSSGAAAAYVREGYSNIFVSECFSRSPRRSAPYLARLSRRGCRPSGLAIVFGCVLLYSAYLSGHRHDLSSPEGPPDRWATLLRLDSTYPTPAGERRYHVRGVPAGFGLMYVAGVLSGLLGIGSGAVKVLAMDQAMRLPFKVSTTTSNFMIGVTAAASAGVYLRRGYIDPGLAMPVVLGVLFGSMQGARVLASAPAHRLRVVFMWVIVALAAEMLFNSVTGRI